MLTGYVFEQDRIRPVVVDDPSRMSRLVWLDLLHPSSEEEHHIEEMLKIEVPTQADMQEIEASSRLYSESNALFMTALLLAGTDTPRPVAQPVTFILTRLTLITVRYNEPRSFPGFAARAQKTPGEFGSGESVLVGLLETIIDRTADVLEKLSAEVEALSRDIFEQESEKPTRVRKYHDILRNIGQKGDLNGKARESLVSLGRLLAFLNQRLDKGTTAKSLQIRIKSMSRDVHSLTDHASFQSSKIGFLLDATLGMVTIQQNAIIKIFSVAAVVFLPPTLIASIYGMNFRFIPELDWPIGYPLAIILMIVSSILPYHYFKRRGWL